MRGECDDRARHGGEFKTSYIIGDDAFGNNSMLTFVSEAQKGQRFVLMVSNL